MKNIFLIVPVVLLINGCASNSFMTVLPTCDIKVPTVAVETFRNDGRRIFENKCEIEQGKRCDSLYVDEVERFSYSSYTIDNLRYFRKMQKKECGF